MRKPSPAIYGTVGLGRHRRRSTYEEEEREEREGRQKKPASSEAIDCRVAQRRLSGSRANALVKNAGSAKVCSRRISVYL
jgi:hypothetical protein